MSGLLEKYYFYMEDPEIIITLIDLLPTHMQYIFVRHLNEVKSWFVEGDYNIKQQGIIRIENDGIIAENNDGETKCLLTLPEPWQLNEI